jgi:phosphatidylserine/phosphatidylglycerophosphate/cardiolipin synthase-like enzyme
MPVKLNCYGLSDHGIVDALLAHHAAGDSVIVLCDRTQASGRSDQVQLGRLTAAGVEVHITSAPTGQIDHHKYVIVGSSVLYGSYNFSMLAQSENNACIIGDDDPVTVAAFEANWATCYAWALAHHETAGNVSLCPTCGTPLGDETETE